MIYFGLYKSGFLEGNIKSKILKVVSIGFIIYLCLYFFSNSEFGKKKIPIENINTYLSYLFFLDLIATLLNNRMLRLNSDIYKSTNEYEGEMISRPNLYPVYNENFNDQNKKDKNKKEVEKENKNETRENKKVIKENKKPIKDNVEKKEINKLTDYCDEEQSSLFLPTYKREKNEEIEIPIYTSN